MKYMSIFLYIYYNDLPGTKDLVLWKNVALDQLLIWAFTQVGVIEFNDLVYQIKLIPIQNNPGMLTHIGKDANET